MKTYTLNIKLIHKEKNYCYELTSTKLNKSILVSLPIGDHIKILMEAINKLIVDSESLK